MQQKSCLLIDLNRIRLCLNHSDQITKNEVAYCKTSEDVKLTKPCIEASVCMIAMI